MDKYDQAYQQIKSSDAQPTLNPTGIKTDDPSLGPMLDKYDREYQSIKANYSQKFTPDEKTVGGFVGNIAKSAGKLASGIGHMIVHPIDTAKGLGSALITELSPLPAGGSLEDTYTPEEQKKLELHNTLQEEFGKRYGDMEAVKNTAYSDPIGFALDASMILSGAGKIADMSKLPKVASGLEAASESVNPVGSAVKVIGKGVESLTKDKTVGISPKSFQPDVARIASEEGVALPPSALTKSKTVQISEAGLGRGLFGDKIIKKVETAKQKLLDISDKTERQANIAIEKATKNYLEDGSDLRSVGETVKKGFEGFKDNFQKEKTKMYSAVPTEVNAQPAVLDATRSVTQSILDEQGSSLVSNKGMGMIEELNKKLNPETEGAKPITFQQLKKTRSDIGTLLKNRLDPVTTGMKGQLERLYAALSDDADATLIKHDPSAKAALDSANAFYRENIQKINSSIGRKIQSSDPEKLVDSLVKKNGETTISQVKEIVSPEAMTDLQTAFLNKLFLNSQKDGTVDLKLVKKNLSKYGDPTVQALLTPEQYKKLQATISELENIEATKAAKMERVEKLQNSIKAGTRISEGSQTSFIQKFQLRSLAAGAGLINPKILLAIVADIVGEAAATKFFTSQLGQDFLTKGIKLDGSAGRYIMNKAKPAGEAAQTAQQAQKYVPR